MIRPSQLFPRARSEAEHAADSHEYATRAAPVRGLTSMPDTGQGGDVIDPVSIPRTVVDLRSHCRTSDTSASAHLDFPQRMASPSMISFFRRTPGRQGPEVVSCAIRDAGPACRGGLALIAWALYRYWHVNQDIRRGAFRPLDRAVVAVTVLLLVLGGFTTAWLFFQQH